MILERNGSVFCLRRHNTGYADGTYTLPSGHVEDGETVVDAAIRELKEETGIIIQEEQLAYVHTLYRYRKDYPYLDFCFVVNDWEGEPMNAEPEKCDHADWFPLDALPENMLPYIPHMLEAVKGKRPFSEYPCEGI